METRIIDFTVSQQEIVCDVPTPFPRTNTKEYLFVRFTVDAIWDTLKKLVVFRRSGTPTLTVQLHETMMCELPPQMLAVPAGSGVVTVHVGMIGIGAGDYRLTTGEAQVRIDPSCYAQGQTPGEPPQDVYEELLKRVEDAEEIDPEEIRAAIDEYLQQNPIDVPIMSETVAGIAKVGDNLKIDSAGRLSVDTADEVEGDNTRPITAAAVYSTVGNIEILLGTI